jgi:outer membrane protein OmpA-like peptidoglycan-associated protein
MRIHLSLAVCLAAFAAPGHAQTACDTALAALTGSFDGGNVPAIMGAWAAVQATPGCPAATVAGARSQTSAVIARSAQAALATGDVDGAEAIVLQAPGMHWAVQAVRGDIAAKRGQRDEAAKLYNAALDTLGDPGLTVQYQQLVPVAERLAKLAQENMMLAGSMKTSVARGGKATGVMGMVSRGLSIEKVAAPPADPDYVPPKEGDAGYVEPVAPTYVEPEYNVVAAAAASVETVFLPIRFDFDSDRLDATGVREAISLSEFLKANDVGAITIIGHTDDVGDENYNLDLSLRRAESLAAFLVSDGIPTTITVVGKGEFEPPVVVDAQIYSIEEFRTIARRVEVAFGY